MVFFKKIMKIKIVLKFEEVLFYLFRKFFFVVGFFLVRGDN